MKPAVVPNRIALDDRGRPCLADYNIRIGQIVQIMRGDAPTPEDLHEALPRIPLAAIHAALSYYYDHQGEIDQSLAEEKAMIAKLRAEAGESPLLRKLRERGLR